MRGYRSIPVIYMRGGTSKGAYVDLADLSADATIRDKEILSLYGSPDKRQIDGLGGADSLTSKLPHLNVRMRT